MARSVGAPTDGIRTEGYTSEANGKEEVMEEEVVDGEAVEEHEFLPAIRDAAVPSLIQGRTPAEIVANAEEIASALADVIEKKNLYKNISGKRHVLVEGWTLLGSLLGVVPIVEWTRQTPDGWEARVVARTMGGVEVGAAEAMCSRRESRWKGADEYAIRSMAQTRATSKALRGPLGFIVELAGYSATPESELSDDATDAPRAGTSASSAPVADSWPALLDAYNKTFYPHPWNEWWLEIAMRRFDVKLGADPKLSDALHAMTPEQKGELWKGCLAALDLIPASDLGPTRAEVREGFTKAFAGVAAQGPMVSMSPDEADHFPTFTMYQAGDRRPASVAAKESVGESGPSHTTPSGESGAASGGSVTAGAGLGGEAPASSPTEGTGNADEGEPAPAASSAPDPANDPFPEGY